MISIAFPYIREQFLQSKEATPPPPPLGEHLDDFGFKEMFADSELQSNCTAKKIRGCCAILEILIYIGAIGIGYLIHKGSLPASLQFLKDRMQLATTLVSVGMIGLSLPSICLIHTNFK